MAPPGSSVAPLVLRARLARIRSRRRARGVTMLEYLAFLVLVIVPSISVAVIGFQNVYLWYTSFVRDVSQSTP